MGSWKEELFRQYYRQEGGEEEREFYGYTSIRFFSCFSTRIKRIRKNKWRSCSKRSGSSQDTNTFSSDLKKKMYYLKNIYPSVQMNSRKNHSLSLQNTHLHRFFSFSAGKKKRQMATLRTSLAHGTLIHGSTIIRVTLHTSRHASTWEPYGDTFSFFFSLLIRKLFLFCRPPVCS